MRTEVSHRLLAMPLIRSRRYFRTFEPLQRESGDYKMNNGNQRGKNANVDYCGVIILIRALVQAGSITKKEARQIAARVAACYGATIILDV